MNEHRKIAEARHFLQRLSKNTSTPTEFRFEVSAFLSSSRSALQYALDEAKTVNGGQGWFDCHSKAPAVRYLKEKRDINIHVEPVLLQLGFMFSESISLSCVSVSGTLTDVNGNPSPSVTTHNNLATETAPHTHTPAPTPASTSIFYRFNDWSGPEDVYTLCERYVVQIEAIVAEGRAKGFLTSPAA